MKNIRFGNLSIPITDYASQGNAILGIRDSGKSYTATYVAERLLENGIPFVAFDPIGIWKYLRVAGKGKGYPIIVAGGRTGDLPLTPQSAPEIVRAAMRENLPLVLDLYSIQLSKADWKSIVEKSIRLLLYENGDHGLRHIFIEEAAEFVPQRVGPDQGAVYGEVEKLARMGGNALLGYTLINQRAEEVNKAVLELCDCLFLHRQKGRNSLTALTKWLDIGDVADSRPIIQSLPKLPQGECWIWASGSDKPERVKVPAKNSFHPDRRALIKNPTLGKGYQAVDVSAFVAQMSGTLEKVIAESQANDPAALRRQLAEAQRQLKQAQIGAPAPKAERIVERVEVSVFKDGEVKRLEAAIQQAADICAQISGMMPPLVTALTETTREVSTQLRAAAARQSAPVRTNVHQIAPARMVAPTQTASPPSTGALPVGEKAILSATAQYPEGVTREQLTILTGYKRSSRDAYLQRLRNRGYIDDRGQRITSTAEGVAALGHDYQPLPVGAELREYWLARLPRGEREIFAIALENYPNPIPKSELESLTNYKRSSRDAYIQRLRARMIVEDDRGTIKARPFLFQEL